MAAPTRRVPRTGSPFVPLAALAPLALAMCGGSSSSSTSDGGSHVVHGADGSVEGGASSGGGDGAPGDDAAGGSSSSASVEDGSSSSGAGGSAEADTPPSSCLASDMGNAPLGTDTPDATGMAVDAITYTNVGATGSYDRVVTSTVAPSCTANVCDKVATSVSGPLVPFNEEMTLVFSGPMDLYQVAVYDPAAGAGSGYGRVAYWDRCTEQGLAWVGNKSWYQCNGYVQSYVTNDGTMSSPTPVEFAGHLDPGVGVNVMSSTLCTGTTDGTDCGFSRGLALHGFKGDAAGSKIFATKFRMPLGNVTPAYWILPAQVVRSAQYGCNCRGQGGQGGCGELDVAEVLGGNTATPAHPEQATTTIYSFQGVTNGGTAYFQRPVYETATLLVIFDAASSSIAMRRLGATEFDFGSSIPAATVSGWLANASVKRAMP